VRDSAHCSRATDDNSDYCFAAEECAVTAAMCCTVAEEVIEEEMSSQVAPVIAVAVEG
jgi:hypothetical protein